MKIKDLSIIPIAVVALYGLSSCNKGDDHDHAGHDHGEHAAHDDAGDHEGHDHEGHDHEGHDHDHATIIPGPNGGRVLTGVEPHAEFFVTDDRKVQITFVDDELKPVSAADQSVSVIAGDRSSPTSLSFAKSGTILVSDKVLPEGNDFPVVVQIKTNADAETVREKFNLNLLDCPTCEYKEYACTCNHDHDE